MVDQHILTLLVRELIRRRSNFIYRQRSSGEWELLDNQAQCILFEHPDEQEVLAYALYKIFGNEMQWDIQWHR